MKKTNRKVRKKLFWLKHSEKLLKRRIKSKRKKKNRNSFFNVSVQKKEIIRNDNKLKKKALTYEKHIIAPQIFSLIYNTDETLDFIKNINECYDKNKNVYMDLEKVETIDSGAIVILLSTLVKFKEKKLSFIGNKPSNKIARNILVNSGFFGNSHGGNEISTHNNKIVDAKYSASLIEKISNFVVGLKCGSTALQRVFIELMQNTHNHASFKNKGEKFWWISVNYIQENKEVLVSFFDNGVGILDSLNNKSNEPMYIKIWNAIKDKLDNKNNKILENLIKGEIAKLEKEYKYERQYFRGKGIPSIYKVFKENKLSDLIIITNNVIARCSDNKYEILKTKLNGTFVSWKIKKSNFNLEYKNGN